MYLFSLFAGIARYVLHYNVAPFHQFMQSG